MKQRLIRSPDDAAALIASLAASSTKVLDRLRRSDEGVTALGGLWALKFQPIGCDPLDVDRPLNLIEQLNQTSNPCHQVSWQPRCSRP